jgi:hypothetical protein
MSLRRASTADLAGIQQWIVDAYGKYVERIGRPAAPMTADLTAAMRTARVWVLEDRDALVGALVTEHRGDHLPLETIAVTPAELGLTEVRLYTNEAMTENLTFYPLHGYRETGRAVQDGFRRVYFSKTVRPPPS